MAWEKRAVPAPVLITEPDPLPKVPEMVILPTLFKVKLAVLLVMVLVKFKPVPGFSEVMVGVPPAASVMRLLIISVPLAVLSIKEAVPVRVMVLELAKVPPLKLVPKVAPSATEIAPLAAAPKPLVLVTFKVPALIEVEPL